MPMPLNLNHVQYVWDCPIKSRFYKFQGLIYHSGVPNTFEGPMVVVFLTYKIIIIHFFTKCTYYTPRVAVHARCTSPFNHHEKNPNRLSPWPDHRFLQMRLKKLKGINHPLSNG